MALSWSQGIRDFVNVHGAYKRALGGGILEIRTGSPPATANTAISGTLLCTVSLASGAVTKEVLSKGCITLTGSGGSVDSITVGGKEILGAVVAWDTSLAITAAAVAAQINKHQPITGEKYIATSNGDVITISAMYGTGTAGNGTAGTVIAGVTTMGATVVSLGGTAGTGIAGSNGLTYGACTSGVLVKSGVWSGTNIVTGVAGYFRILGSENDGGTASTTAIRVQGVCGISSGDYPMTTTTLTAGQTHTVDTFALTLPAA